MDLVSIIVPVYNCEKYLKECVKSIINQTYKNIEVFLVDDGSTDNSGSICDELSKMDKRLIVIHKNNSGVSSARNEAIKKVTGKYILFVDSDDYIERDYVETLRANLDTHDMVVCGYIEEYKKKSIEMRISKSDMIIDKIEANRLIFENRSFGGYLWNKLFITKVIKENNILFNEQIHMCEDQLFIINYLLYINSIKIINKMLYHYRMRKSSMVWNKNDKKMNTFYDSQLEIKKIYKKNNILNEMFYYNLCNYIFVNNTKKNNKMLKEKYKINVNKIYKEIIKSKKISINKKIRLFVLNHLKKIYLLYINYKTKRLVRFD